MSFNKDRVMQELQRFGGAMYTPVILFAFFGLTVALSIIFSNTGLFGSLAEKGTLWYDFWYVVHRAPGPSSIRCRSSLPSPFPLALPRKNRPAVPWKVSSSTWYLTISSPVS